MAITPTGASVPLPPGTTSCVERRASTASTRVASTAQPKPSRGTSVPAVVGTQASMCSPARVVSKTTVSGAPDVAIWVSVAQASSTASRRSSTASRS
jgi:hypothetical protein